MTAKKNLENTEKLLENHNQSHLLALWDQLDAAQRQALLAQIEQLDFARIDDWVANFVKKAAPDAIPADVTAAPSYGAVPADSDQQRKYDQAGKLGRELISTGQDSVSTAQREISQSAPSRTRHCFKSLPKPSQQSQKNTKPPAPGIL
jgi:hypothetical protein